MTFTIAFTGHRPDDLGGYNESNPVRDTLKVQLRQVLLQYKVEHPDLLCISGMALGFDQWAAEVCVELGIPFTAAIPFVGFDSIWSAEQRDKYNRLRVQALNVHFVCSGGYEAWKMQKRNEWMVDHCDVLVAAWNGEQIGGTWNTVKYARKKERQEVNLLPVPVAR